MTDMTVPTPLLRPSLTCPQRRTLLAAAGVAALLTACAQAPLPAAQQDLAGRNAGSTVVFASQAAGRTVLEADDDYMQAAGDFQRRAVMGRAVQGRESPAPPDDFRRWSGDAARDWQPAQRERWRAAAAVVLPAFEALQIPLPPQVLLVATNGQESAHAPHTRANAVMLPMKDGEPPTARDAFVLAHELWHVASRHAPALAGSLYGLIGFEPMPELRYPPAWAALRLANPDAADNRHAMALQLDGRDVQVTPLLVAKRTTLATAKETFFDALDVRLLEVTWTPGAAASQAVIGDDGQPRWHPINPAYLARLGGNTGYVIHPEETIADNIALLAMQQAGQPGPPVRNQALLDRLRAVLTAPR